MGAQLAQYQNQGMSRDVSGSIEQRNLVYENLNIRITTRGQETLLITTNEKGNAAISITDSNSSDSTNLSIIGVLLGYAVLGSHLILFTHDDSDDDDPDRIYHIIHDNDSDTWSGYLMVEGDLNFDNEWPIETLVDYEGDTVQKVYWVDGRNQPRMLNFIEDDDDTLQSKFDANSSYFDFVTKFTVDPLLGYSITKSYDSISNFHSGTVQYFFTYSNKYGQETNIVNLTDLQYLAYADRGADAESTVPCKFTIELSNVDTSFDHLNIYSVVTTSYNTTQAAYKVVELAINGSETLSYVDDGSYDTANATDADSLLYIGGRVIVPYTMTVKDQVLFLGNYILGTGNADDNEEYIEAIRTILRADIYTETYLSANNITDDQNRPLVGINPNIKFVPEVTVSGDAEEVIDGTSHGITEIEYVWPTGLYPYESQLKETSGKITVFKGGELYRFGVQFMDSTGALSQVFWIGDQWNDIYPSINEDYNISRAVVKYSLPFTDSDGNDTELAAALQALDYQVVTLMIAQASSSDRRVLAQGFLCPTMYNLEQRVNDSIWSIPSWYTRFRNGELNAQHCDGTDVNTTKYCEIQCIDEIGSPYYDMVESEYEYAYLTITLYIKAKSASGWDNRAVKVVGQYYDSSDQEVGDAVEEETGWAQKGSTTRKRMENILKNTFNLSESDYNATDAYSTICNYLSTRQLADTISNSWNSVGSFTITFGSMSYAALQEYLRKWRNQYFIDESIVTFHSPEIDEDTAAQFDNISPKLRIVGIAEKTAIVSDFTMSVDNPGSAAEAYMNSSVDFTQSNIAEDPTGLVAYPLWHDKGITTYANLIALYNESKTFSEIAQGTYFMVYPWHKEGSMQCLEDADTGNKISDLESKTEANLHFAYQTKYFWASRGDAETTNDEDLYQKCSSNGGWVPSNGISTLRSYWYDEPQAMQLSWNNEGHTYQGIYDYVVSAIVSDEDYSNGYMVYNTGLKSPENVSYGNIFVDSGTENLGKNYNVSQHLNGYDNTSASGLMPVSANGFQTSIETELDTFYGCVDPVRIAFKSTPHAVIKLNPTDENAEVILPSLDIDSSLNGTDLDESCYAWDVTDYIDSGTVATTIYTFLSTATDNIFDISSGNELNGDTWDDTIAEVFTDFDTTAYSEGSTTLISSTSAGYGMLIGTDSSSFKPYLISELVASRASNDEQDISVQFAVLMGAVSVSATSDSDTGVTLSGSVKITSTTSEVIESVSLAITYYNSSMGDNTSFELGTIEVTEDEDTDDSEDTSNVITSGTFTVSGGSFDNTTYAPSTSDSIKVTATVTLTNEYTSYSFDVTSDVFTLSSVTSLEDATSPVKTYKETITVGTYYNVYTVTFATAALELDETGVIALFKIYETYNKAKLYYEDSTYKLDTSVEFPTTAISQDTLPLPSGTEESDLNPYVFIAELYMDKDRDEYYGGVSDSALENNTFIMAGKRTTIDFTNGTTLIGTEGDAFFQRWDCLKTYPYSTDYTNSIVDIFSFMVETHVNIDGRYDNRRGLTENRNNTTENFGLINKVYTQENNFVTGNIFDESTDETSYSNCVTWTTAKTPMADTDAWTNITTASSLPMDGRYGEIELLESNGSDIFCVQDKAVAKIRYNSNSAISASDGVPIQLAMSGVVDGKVYATTAFGCQNKWSAHLLGGDLYFVDNINEEFVTLGASDYYGQNKVEGLLSKNGFKDWLKSLKLGIQRWNPVDFANFRTYVDTKNMDVYYVLGSSADDGYKTALCYSSMLGKFESFYSYGGTPMMVNIDDKFISFHADDSDEDSENGLLWEQGAGEYNSIWGKDYPYWIIWRMSPNPLLDKIYGNIEYKADIFDMDRPEKDDDGNVNDSDEEWREGKGMLSQDTFDYMKVWNEYQWNEVSIDTKTLLRGNWDKYPDIRQKFRSWRIDIPRDRKNKDNPYGLNRMRNPWLALKLAKTTADDLAKHGRMEFYNMILKYWSA